MDARGAGGDIEMTTTEKELLLDHQATTAREVVPNCCPYWRFKKEEGKVLRCEGAVVFVAGEEFGVCQDCGRHVPLSVEM